MPKCQMIFNSIKKQHFHWLSANKSCFSLLILEMVLMTALLCVIANVLSARNMVVI